MGLEHNSFRGLRKSIAAKIPDSLSEKWEDRMRHKAAEKYGFTEVNEAVSYHCEPDNVLNLHVPEMLKERSPQEIIAAFSDGLRRVASRLQNDPTMSNIQHIEGYAWLPYYYPGVARKLGFEITHRDDEFRVAVAHMSRDEFLKRYGTKK